MAPRNSRGKAKGEKKKKEEKVLPVVMDITVNLIDEARVVLKIVLISAKQTKLEIFSYVA
ncbi:hypothetical protein SESBI_08258 [Sesbania bispinosa]|nr:hypothetical protein SESBI_08258 [Sesbania bispinosa]